MNIRKLLAKVVDSERLAHDIYSRLYLVEKDKKLKNKLKELKAIDIKHLETWDKIDSEMKLRTVSHTHGLEVASILFVRRLFGKDLTLSIINSIENRKISDLSKVFHYIPNRYKPKIIDYLVEELYQERLLKQDSKSSGIITNIRDVVFGMNDGLVEVLAAVAGFTGVLHDNLLILIAGTIVGLSGTISMAVGAYLASKSEKDVENDSINRLELELQVAKERLIEDLKKHSRTYEKFDKGLDELIIKLKKFRDPVYKVLERERGNPLMKFLAGKGRIYDRETKTGINPVKDAIYVGAFYILGAIIPLVSFLAGVIINTSPYLNLVISVTLTVITIGMISTVIAMNSNENIGRYMGRAISLSLLAAAVTFFIGYIASSYLHIAV
ncbi:MAG: VIT1/CCC1 transporter family protein [Candidatus Parvarchaeota archaeon]|nr:VIT1/CCC1 transporter family protein [Candidatus Parvarchaeota archaeon]